MFAAETCVCCLREIEGVIVMTLHEGWGRYEPFCIECDAKLSSTEEK